MDLSEKTQIVTDLMKSTKESWVERDPENPDLAIYLHLFRGDELVCTVQCPLNRDTALKAAHLAAAGFNASTITLTFESYHTELKESPITGKRWMPREMQFVAETHPEAWENGWVAECLTTSAHERGGGYELFSQAYRIKDGKVEWGDTKSVKHSNEQGDHEGGLMFDHLQQAMATPTVEEQLEEQAKENPLAAMVAGLIEDPERRQFHIDMATAKALEDNDLAVGVMVLADDGSERAQWLAERLGTADYRYEKGGE